MNEYFDRLLNSITSSVKSLDIVEFERLADMAVEAEKSNHKIIATGLGKNVPICEKFVGTMASFGLNACFMHSNSAIHGDLGLVRQGDLVLMLTKSADTEESIRLYKHLATRNACLWLMTFNPSGYLTKEFHNVLALTLDHEGDLWNILPNNSTTVYLIILQALAVRVAEKLEIQPERFSHNHPGGAIGQKMRNG